MFSIVIPCFNRSHLLIRAVKSVISQTYRDWELIIIDDGSSADMMAALGPVISGHERIRYVKLSKNTGVANARNVGVSLASRDFICFLDSDDEWHSSKLEKQCQLIKSDHDLTFLFGAILKVGSTVKSVSHKGPVNYSELCRYNFIPLSSVCIHKSVLHGLEFPQVRHEDYCLWLEIFYKRNPCVGYIEDQLVNYYRHDGNLTRNKLMSLLWVFNVYVYHRGVKYAFQRFPLFLLFRFLKALKNY